MDPGEIKAAADAAAEEVKLSVAAAREVARREALDAVAIVLAEEVQEEYVI